MVIAILSFIFSCVSLFAFWWLSIPGIILGIIAITKAEDEDYNIQRAFGIAGTVVGAVALIVLIVAVSFAGISASTI